MWQKKGLWLLGLVSTETCAGRLAYLNSLPCFPCLCVSRTMPGFQAHLAHWALSFQDVESDLSKVLTDCSGFAWCRGL